MCCFILNLNPFLILFQVERFPSSRSRSPPKERESRPPLYREREPRPPLYREREPRPPSHREPSYREPSYRERESHPSDYCSADDSEKQREERLERILQMEREIAMLRSQQEGGFSDSRKPPLNARRESYDRKESYHRSPPPSLNSHGYDSYSRDRDRDLPYRGGNSERGGGMSSGRGYYNRQSPSGERSNSDGYREPVSYPGTGSGGGGNFSRASASVGYGTGSAGSGKTSVPPGWPSGSQDKSNANRPPFAASANTGPWS